MTVISLETDHEHLVVTVVSEFEASVERVWELWADPRKLERWWDPPSYPATFETHHLVPGGQVKYLMSSPEGEKHAGIRLVTAVDPPLWLQFDDFFADADWELIPDLPVTRVSIRLLERDGGTRMVMRSTFESRDDLERWLSMGMREGLEQAIAPTRDGNDWRHQPEPT